MNGGYIHDDILLRQIEEAFRSLGAIVRRQTLSRGTPDRGYCDLTATLTDGKLIAVEAEMTARRIVNDLRKGADINAAELWIVVPNQQVLRASERLLSQRELPSELAVFVLTLPQALARVSTLVPAPMCARGKQEIK